MKCEECKDETNFEFQKIEMLIKSNDFEMGSDLQFSKKGDSCCKSKKSKECKFVSVQNA